MVKIFRVDDRLIHGQVQTQWLSVCNANRVIIIDNNVVKDPVAIQILKLAKPANIRSYCKRRGKRHSVY